MKQEWSYIEETYAVDTEDVETYRDLLLSMVEYSDCMDDLTAYVECTEGDGANLVIRMIWEGAGYILDQVLKGFAEWMMTENEDRIKELVELNCTLVKEEDE